MASSGIEIEGSDILSPEARTHQRIERTVGFGLSIETPCNDRRH
jgi:hypothetical protein